ncbi:hypothetical protein GQ42DRAFT_27949 [Ramicandelaber brevisporus]|nr:hypothetical protein GQ42DRAFT_27949 [Ramicandelaber brevisporus]
MIDEYDDDSQAMNSSQQQQQQQQQQQRPFRIVTTGLPSSLSQPSSPVSFASTIVAATSPSAAMHQQQRSLTSSSTDDISPASTVGSTVDLVAQIATMTTKDSVADTTDGSLTRSSTVVVKRPVPMPAIDYSQFDTAFERAQEWGRQRISQMVWRNDIDD